ncbi:hypothetical protein TNCV_4600451 [Trichonephila clavipes]|nr:hypothetical protein TNCV_4600451 [Trichonephila clavipes]
MVTLRKISQTSDVHFQQMPPHINIRGNDITARLAKEASENKTVTGTWPRSSRTVLKRKIQTKFNMAYSTYAPKVHRNIPRLSAGNQMAPRLLWLD